MKASIVFPHQLFRKHPALFAGTPVYLVEESLFFQQYPFHKQKLILHRASMQFYAQWLRNQGYEVIYVETTDPRSDIRQLLPHLAVAGYTTLHVADPADNWLERRLLNRARQYALQVTFTPTPGFLNPKEKLAAYFKGKKTYFQTDFYIQQRKERNLLLDAAGKPQGGKWTFDAENRERFPKNAKVPVLHFPETNAFVEEAIAYVNQHFSQNLGAATPFRYAVTFDAADAWLQQFLKERFRHFGAYEDAMVHNETYLYHSVLTPMLNVGLLTPEQVLHAALQAAAADAIPINSLEGFVRQIVGWREFIRLVYQREGSRQRTTNYWGFSRPIPPSLYKGTTGITPVDTVIQRVLQTGYCHHIERLMVLGNFMLLCEFDPNAVYRWFMELFVDAYDWVMVPNVYGMTQFADGGLMTTKPYISGSNYLLKMGDWEKGPWCAIWDGLFWRFMHVHRSFFAQNPRLGMLLKTFDKMPAEKQRQHLQTAGAFLEKLNREQ
jgi:deoxyribodipyrimidine photolyase-related protein